MDPTKAPAIDPSVLFDDYYYWRTFTKARPISVTLTPPAITPARLRPFEQLSRWCAEQGLHAREWLYSLFAVRCWVYWPPLTHLRSPAHLKRVRRGDHWPTDRYRERVLAEAGQSDAARQFNPNTDLLETVEEAKRYHLRANDVTACMAVMHDETFGWHPRSTVCARCPGQRSCREKLAREAPAALAVREGADAQRTRQLALLRGANRVGNLTR